MKKNENYFVDTDKKIVYADAKFLNKKEISKIKKLVDSGYKMLPMKEWENK